MGGGGYGGGYGGGMTQNTGLGTGNQWHGNTAFGTAGQMAQGYATRDAASLRAAGMGPQLGSYGNFRTMGGAPMFGGSPIQGSTFAGYGAGQAYSAAQAAYDRWRASQAQAPHVGGLLSDEGVQVSPVADVPPPVPALPPQVMPPAVSIPPNAIMYPFEGPNWQNQFNPGPNNTNIPKNNQGDLSGYGNRSTAYKNSNFASGYGGGSTQYKGW